MKPVIWLGTSRDDVRLFPDVARQALGYQLSSVQDGSSPDNFKHFQSVGAGAAKVSTTYFGAGEW